MSKFDAFWLNDANPVPLAKALPGIGTSSTFKSEPASINFSRPLPCASPVSILKDSSISSSDALLPRDANPLPSAKPLPCLFSLGAVIRLLAPHIKDKKTDPAVIVIDDNANFVISVLSGHLGGANELSNEIAEKMGATSVITTAADVNKTIAVDLVGKEFGWKIHDDSNVTRISAFMVNKEQIGVFQNAGQKEWWKGKMPENITFFSNVLDLKN